MAAVAKQTAGQKRLRELALTGAPLRRLSLVKPPLLLIGDGLTDEERDEEHGRHDIGDSERRLVLQRGPRRQREAEEEDVLKGRDEGGVEQLELQRPEALAQDGPPV